MNETPFYINNFQKNEFARIIKLKKWAC